MLVVTTALPLMNILTFADYYLPGCRAGGPVRSIKNFADEFGDRHQIHVITRDRDVGDRDPYFGVRAGEWRTLGRTSVRYLSPSEQTVATFADIIRSTDPDLIYLNSLFSTFTQKVLLALRSSALSDARVLLAVRGELDPGALKIKSYKKRAFLKFARLVGLHQRVEFQASSTLEKSFIENHFPHHRVHVACNVPESRPSSSRRVCPKPVDFVFMSRVSPKKNLETVLNAYSELVRTANAFSGSLRIYGDSDDPDYLHRVRGMVDACGDRVTLCGSYDHDDVWSILRQAAFTVLPTWGENFGHSIYESAVAGVPFLISDRTPWTDAAIRGAGWVLPPDDPQAWMHAMLRCSELSDAQYSQRSQAAISAAEHFRRVAVNQHQRLLESIAGTETPRLKTATEHRMGAE